MIPSRQEILNCVYGSWRLARFDAAGVQFFDGSPAAALRSFFAAVLVAPAFIIALLFSDNSPPAIDPLAVFLVVLLSYCLAWTAFPLIAFRVCQLIDREKAFFRFLSATNWASVITAHLALVVAVLKGGGIAPEALAPLLEIALFGYLIAYQWFIIRHCLDVSVPAAIGFVALAILIDFLIISIVAGILYPSGG